eukprot:scaffold227190_cov14-Tisochrysis_lutea.AAC.1
MPATGAGNPSQKSCCMKSLDRKSPAPYLVRGSRLKKSWCSSLKVAGMGFGTRTPAMMTAFAHAASSSESMFITGRKGDSHAHMVRKEDEQICR